MLDYLTLFNTHADYNTYINSQDKVLPNVSYCANENEVHYNPYELPSRVITAIYSISDTQHPTVLTYEDGWYDIESVMVTRPNGTTFELTYNDLVLYDPYGNDDPLYGYQFDTTGNHTFEYTLSQNVNTIHNDFLNMSDKLISVTIPNSVTTIGDLAFAHCSSLTSVTIPNSVTTIGDLAFGGCSGLTSITIPNSVTSIVRSAFDGCSGLTSIVANSGNTVYDSRNNCNAIIETATNTLFLGCQNTVIPNTVTSIGNYAFQNCTGLTSVTIPNTVTTIGNNAFYGCSSLTSITIPNSVTTIGNYAFYNCRGLTSVIIPNSVTSIGESAFNNCTGLTSVTIGNGVTSISVSAFSYCTGLTSVTIQATTPPTLSNVIAFYNTNNCPIYVPSASVNTYKAATNWSDLSSRIQAIP